MAKIINRLTEVRCSKANVGLHPDGDGLYLQVRSPTARSWLYRYMIAAKSREMGLGAYPATTLEIARTERDRFKRVRQSGEDPIELRDRERNAVQIERAKATKFSRAALEYLALKAPQWGNEKHRKQWLSTLKTYVEPVLGELPVQSIEPWHVLKVLEPIWLTKSETATRVRSRIEMILDYCSSMNYRKGENPARWRGCLKDLLPALDNVVETKHHPALPHAEIPEFMAELRAIESVTARALEFVILTAVRANEALKAVPTEVNQAERIWTVPKVRMKGRKGKKREHRVPLCDRALKIAQAFRRDDGNPYLFPGMSSTKSVSDGSLLAVLDRMGYGHVTTHGFRSSFRTWVAEETNFPGDVAERALAHVLGDETEEAYNRSELLLKRRNLMEAWAEYCGAKRESGGSNVVVMNPGGTR